MSTKDDTNPGTHAVPIPVRYWWLKRILIAAGIVFVSLLCLRLWWGHVAHQRLQAEIDRIRAAGEPLFPEDFDPDPVHDKDNAAIFLQKAEAAITTPPDVELTINDIVRNPQLCVTRADEVAKLIDANQEALSLLRQARSASGVDWGLRFRSPLIDMMFPSISGQRQLAKLSCAAAMYHHQHGDDAAAVDAIRDTLGASNDLHQDNPILIFHLVAIATSSLAANAIEDIAPTLTIVKLGAASDKTGLADRREQLEALVTELLDDQEMQDGLLWALYGERATQFDLARLTIEGRMSAMTIGMGSPLVYPFKPMVELDAIRMMRFMSALVDAGREPTWPQARNKFPAIPGTSSGMEMVATFFSRMMLRSLDRAILLHYRAVVMRRMAAVALAIRLYEIDHGRRPETLNELVPDYLPGIPSDPFATDGRTIGYLPDAPRPILYSVGSDGIDDQGVYQLRKGGSVDWDAKDHPFFLNGDRPRDKPAPSQRPPPSTETDDDEGNVQNGERNPDQGQSADDHP